MVKGYPGPSSSPQFPFVIIASATLWSLTGLPTLLPLVLIRCLFQKVKQAASRELMHIYDLYPQLNHPLCSAPSASEIAISHGLLKNNHFPVSSLYALNV